MDIIEKSINLRVKLHTCYKLFVYYYLLLQNYKTFMHLSIFLIICPNQGVLLEIFANLVKV